VDNFICNFDPVMLNLAGLSLRWYGFMYLLGFLAVFVLGQWQIKLRKIRLTPEKFFDLIFWIFVSMVIGARLGHFIFYDIYHLFSVELLQVWHGGMSFHGGLLGVVLSGLFLAKKYKLTHLQLADLLTLPSVLALALGRIGNFINCELWGRVSDVPWAVIFPRADLFPRHPAQLYEFVLYFLIFLILFFMIRYRKSRAGVVFFWGLVLLSVARMGNEFFREPDYFVWNWVTIGQVLSLPVLLAGVFGLIYLHRKNA